MPTGTLYVVATPIGNLEDITLRALRVLREVDYITAEDTRHTANLLRKHAISRPLISCHQWNETKRAAEVIDCLRAGKSIALVTDSGTPGISDPGYRVIRTCIDGGVPVIPVPGPTALIAALVVSGLDTGQFRFVGFIPRKRSQRRKLLESLATEPATLVIYESPFRLRDFLEDASEILAERQMVVARELTKKFEEIIRGTPAQLLAGFAARQIKGECTIVIQGARPTPRATGL